MNNMERLLADDLGDLLDRLAAGGPEGAMEDIWRKMPRLRVRLDQDLENVWALAAWRSTAEDALEDVPRMAA